MISPIRGFGLITLALFLSGCATQSACGPQPYMDASARPPLAVPQGLEAPASRGALRVPERGMGGQIASNPDDCVIEPPAFFARAGERNPDGLPIRPSSAGEDAAAPRAGASRLTRELTTFLGEWSEAWSRRDADAWLGFYAADYAPAGYADGEEWREEQRSRFEVPASTRVDAGSVVVEPRSDGDVVARFTQHFGAAPDERGVVKELVLRPVGGKAADWRIVQERIVEVL